MEIDIKVAFRNAADKNRALWPNRSSANRLEPECWPSLNPRFKFNHSAKIFTIGSCFARNIERVLWDAGFDVPVYRFILDHPELVRAGGLQTMNRYSPPTIFQELAWARKIFDRDDTITHGDIDPLLLATKSDLYFDLGRVAETEFGVTLDSARNTRKGLYSLLRSAFSADVIIITLGMIECWKDKRTGNYVEFNRELLRQPNRFCFKRLDYIESLSLIEKSINILNLGHTKQILLTTSPVPLERTFSGDDVIVANCYSKSVLRSVAGYISETMPNVDYFPSFESVILTKKDYVWTNDLRHIETSFVGMIMTRVSEAYVPDFFAQNSAAESLYRIISLVKSGEMTIARELFDQLQESQLSNAPPEFFVSVIELAAFEGDVILADEMANQIKDVVDADMWLRASNALALVGLIDKAAAMRELAKIHGIRSFRGALHWFHVLRQARRFDDIKWMLAASEDQLKLNAAELWSVALMYKDIGEDVLAEHYFLKVIKEDPSHEEARLVLAHQYLLSGKDADGLNLLRPLEKTDCSNLYLHPLVSDHIKHNRIPEARALVCRLLHANPNNQGLLNLADQCSAANILPN